MVSWKSFFIVKAISLFNCTQILYNTICYKYENMSHYFKNYYNGCNDIWVFITGHNPISMNNIKNVKNTDTYWIYDNYKNTLSYSNSTSNYKFSWLSANIKINSQSEYNIDDFIEHLTITDIPSLYIIFMCWCAHTKQWFKADDVTFHVFDDTGDEILVSMNEPLIAKNHKLYVEKKLN